MQAFSVKIYPYITDDNGAVRSLFFSVCLLEEQTNNLLFCPRCLLQASSRDGAGLRGGRPKDGIWGGLWHPLSLQKELPARWTTEGLLSVKWQLECFTTTLQRWGPFCLNSYGSLCVCTLLIRFRTFAYMHACTNTSIPFWSFSQLAVSSLLRGAVWWSVEWSAGRSTLRTQWFLMGKMWRFTANTLTSSAVSQQPRAALMASCSHQPATLVNLDHTHKRLCRSLRCSMSARGIWDGLIHIVDSWKRSLINVFQSPRGCSISCSRTGWSQRLKLVSPRMWTDDLHVWPQTRPRLMTLCHNTNTSWQTPTHSPIMLNTVELCFNSLCCDYGLWGAETCGSAG